MVLLKLPNNDPVQKTMTFLHFFYIFFSKSPFLWNILAKIKKKIQVRNRLNFYLQKPPSLLGNYVALEKYFYWLTAVNFCMANFYLIFL